MRGHGAYECHCVLVQEGRSVIPAGEKCQQARVSAASMAFEAYDSHVSARHFRAQDIMLVVGHV
jgi:hypothetical protein